MKRETGESPVRTRHRILRATIETTGRLGRRLCASEQLAGRPAFHSTGTEGSCHEKLAVRNKKEKLRIRFLIFVPLFCEQGPFLLLYISIIGFMNQF